MNVIGALIVLVLILAGCIVGCLPADRRIRLTGFAAASIAFTIAGFFFWQAHRWESGLKQIRVGDSREHAKHIMGLPTKITDGTTGIYGSTRAASNRISGCTEQYWYYAFFTPECWWIAFDAEGRVLATYHYISP